jgi:hypothetical protein
MGDWVNEWGEGQWPVNMANYMKGGEGGREGGREGGWVGRKRREEKRREEKRREEKRREEKRREEKRRGSRVMHSLIHADETYCGLPPPPDRAASACTVRRARTTSSGYTPIDPTTPAMAPAPAR